MNKTLEVCRLAYNKILEVRKTEWEENKKSLTEFDINKKLCQWRKESEKWLQGCGTAVLYDVSRRVDKAFRDFYKRAKRVVSPAIPVLRGGGIIAFPSPLLLAK